MIPEALTRFPLLAEFDDEDREELASRLERSQLPPGAEIFLEGEEGRGLVLIASGTVRLESGRSAVCGRAAGGSALGGASLLVGGVRQASAFSETPCELLTLTPAAYRHIVSDSPRLACRLLEALARDLATRVRDVLDAHAAHTELVDPEKRDE